MRARAQSYANGGVRVGSATHSASTQKEQSAGPANLYALRIRDIWACVRRQPLSFWFLNGYLFFEYVRPQQIYRWLDVMPFAWTCLWSAVLCFFMEGFKARRLYSADTALAVYTVILLSTFVTAYNPATARAEWSLYFSWMLVYLLITNIIATEERFIIFLLAFFLYSTKMSQHGTQVFAERGGQFASWGANGAPGWFQNSGEFAIQMCIFLAMSGYFIMVLRPHWGKIKLLVMLFMPVTALISIVASSSRGSQLAVGPMVFALMMKSEKRLKALLIATIVGVSVWVLLPSEQRARFSDMGEDDSSNARIEYWRRGVDIVKEHGLMGVGYNNWIEYNQRRYGAWRNSNDRGILQLPHNIFIQAAAELGVPGLLAFFALIFMTLHTNRQTRRAAVRQKKFDPFLVASAHSLDIALIGYVVAGFFVTVLYYPFFWINYAFTVALHNIVIKRGEAEAQAESRAVRQATAMQQLRHGAS